ncbi:hypothetical protein T484DRAFT_3048624 [Baffinella frigidus]|nr:hypothetical protein T484DRAFT_3048624 [Cryptophyta sp. CCMP2293]
MEEAMGEEMVEEMEEEEEEEMAAHHDHGGEEEEGCATRATSTGATCGSAASVVTASSPGGSSAVSEAGEEADGKSSLGSEEGMEELEQGRDAPSSSMVDASSSSEAVEPALSAAMAPAAEPVVQDTAVQEVVVQDAVVEEKEKGGKEEGEGSSEAGLSEASSGAPPALLSEPASASVSTSTSCAEMLRALPPAGTPAAPGAPSAAAAGNAAGIGDESDSGASEGASEGEGAASGADASGAMPGVQGGAAALDAHAVRVLEQEAAAALEEGVREEGGMEEGGVGGVGGVEAVEMGAVEEAVSSPGRSRAASEEGEERGEGEEMGEEEDVFEEVAWVLECMVAHLERKEEHASDDMEDEEQEAACPGGDMEGEMVEGEMMLGQLGSEVGSEGMEVGMGGEVPPVVESDFVVVGPGACAAELKRIS